MNCKLLFFLIIFSAKLHAQNAGDSLFFKDRLQPVAPENIFKTEGYYNWGPSITKGEDGKYHLIYSRWKKEHSFYGWLTFSEAAHAVADHPAGPYTYKETILKSRGGKKWDAINVHNPRIHYFDGKYYLYYIGTHMDSSYTEDDLLQNAQLTAKKSPIWMQLRNNQRTGVAVSKTMSGPWKRQNKPLIEPSGPITTLTVNPTIAKGKDDRFYLIVKGDRDRPGGARNQALAIGKKSTGPFVMQPKPVINYMNTEDMAMWYDAKRDYYYSVFHNENIIYKVSSPDGINWNRATEFEILRRDIAMADGSRLTPNELQRPFVYEENGEPLVLAVAVRDETDSYILLIPIAQEKN